MSTFSSTFVLRKILEVNPTWKQFYNDNSFCTIYCALAVPPYFLLGSSTSPAVNLPTWQSLLTAAPFLRVICIVVSLIGEFEGKRRKWSRSHRSGVVGNSQELPQRYSLSRLVIHVDVSFTWCIWIALEQSPGKLLSTRDSGIQHILIPDCSSVVIHLPCISLGASRKFLWNLFASRLLYESPIWTILVFSYGNIFCVFNSIPSPACTGTSDDRVTHESAIISIKLCSLKDNNM